MNEEIKKLEAFLLWASDCFELTDEITKAEIKLAELYTFRKQLIVQYSTVCEKLEESLYGILPESNIAKFFKQKAKKKKPD